MRYLIGNDLLAKWRMFISRANSDALGYISVVELDVRNYNAVLKTFWVDSYYCHPFPIYTRSIPKDLGNVW